MNLKLTTVILTLMISVSACTVEEADNNRKIQLNESKAKLIQSEIAVTIAKTKKHAIINDARIAEYKKCKENGLEAITASDGITVICAMQSDPK